MQRYNPKWDRVGRISTLGGLGTIIWGIASRDLSLIAGGAALVYTGRCLLKTCSEESYMSRENERLLIDIEKYKFDKARFETEAKGNADRKSDK